MTARVLMSLPSLAGSCRPEPEASPAPTSPPSRSHPRRPAGGEACCRIPTRFDEVADRSFCFVHVDVDLFEPTRESIAFFYPRMVPGGVMLFDDYGFVTCPGATRAIDEFTAEHPEPLVHVPTAQAFLIKGA